MAVFISAIVMVSILALFYFGCRYINKVSKAMTKPSKCPSCGAENALKPTFSVNVFRHNLKKCEECGYIVEYPG